MSTYYPDAHVSLARVFEQYSQTIDPHAHVKPIYGGFHLKALADGHCIHLHRMLVNWRLGEWHGPCDHVASRPGRYWCYQGLGMDTFIRAAGQGLAWDGSDDSEPEGWIKNYRGQYGDRLTGETRTIPAREVPQKGLLPVSRQALGEGAQPS